MTLAIGDKVVKLDPETGEPMKAEKESYIEYEVEQLTPTFTNLARAVMDEEADGGVRYDAETYTLVLLRKIL